MCIRIPKKISILYANISGYMGKGLLVLCILVLTFSVYPSSTYAAPDLSGCKETQFQVTGYYSPLKDQSYYFKGNFQDEVILNGRGTHGASGRAVFNGMIAAPKTYSFGTQIYFPEYGRGQVEDRGGAIVEAGVRDNIHDRIDIWMGHGEKGLIRAVSLGIPTLTGYICPANTTTAVGFDESKFHIYTRFFETTLWIQQLRKGREDPWVSELQRFLKLLGYMESVTGYFGDVTHDAVCSFQQRFLSIDENSSWCGYFGPDTRKVLHQQANQVGATHHYKKVAEDDFFASEELLVQDSHDVAEEESIPEPEIEEEKEAPKDWEGNPVGDTDPENMRKYREGDAVGYDYRRHIPNGENSREVKLLQRKLQVMGHYRQDINGIYDAYMREAIYELQRDHAVLTGDDPAHLRGYFGPGTRKAINNWKY